MAILNVRFSVPAKGLFGLFGRAQATQGQITLIDIGVHRFTNADIERFNGNIPHAIQGYFSGFPSGLVKQVSVVATTDKDYQQYTFPVDGRDQGDFCGTVYLWHGNQITPIRFDGFDAQGKPLFRTDYYNVMSELVGNVQPSSPTASDSTKFLAKIVEITKGTHSSGDIPVVVTWQVDTVPSGTTGLAMAFVTNQEWAQGRSGWTEPGQYKLQGNVWSGHRDIIGNPAGSSESIEAILRATGNPTPAEVRIPFTLDKVKMV